MILQFHWCFIERKHRKSKRKLISNQPPLHAAFRAQLQDHIHDPWCTIHLMDLDDVLMPQVSKQLHFWLGLRGTVTEDLFPRETLLAALVLDLFHLDGGTFRVISGLK